jgi:protein-S-isoprenylcysteine O-methyltransferase Ste14
MTLTVANSHAHFAGCHESILKRNGLVLRLCGSTWFLLLAVMAMRGWIVEHDDGWPVLLSRGALVLVYLTVWMLILVRPAPISAASGIMPGTMAFTGTYMPWLISLTPRQSLSGCCHLAATILILCGSLLTLVVVMYLGRSFSVVPQARKLVTTGPYALIRHPLYLMEELMILGTALLYISPLTVALVSLHFIVQIRRMFYEEAVLCQAFPEYSFYKRHTWRILPYIW